jgi:hypothetical protein
MPDQTAVLRDPEWLPHRYDAVGDRIHFVHADRTRHRAATFLTDDYLPGAKQPFVINRPAAVSGAPPPAPVHFLFHSAFCCSTLLVRALDREGVAMGMSEPQILNDIVGWRHRVAVEGPRVAMVLDHSLRLLARPFGPGEAVVVKPSNLLNGLAAAMLGLRPQAGALLLYAPLDAFLASIARKGLWGRIWIRDLLVKLGREGLLDFGITGDDLLKLTDIQVAAFCWLGQHRLFAQLATRFASRVRTLDSEQLLARPAETMAALARLYGLALAPTDLAKIVEGPAFTRNSKTGDNFSAADRAAERDAGLKAHADEVGKVSAWARELARSNSITLDLPNPLLG